MWNTDGPRLLFSTSEINGGGGGGGGGLHILQSLFQRITDALNSVIVHLTYILHAVPMFTCISSR